MKMHFSRNDSGETQVKLLENGIEAPFNYITLVKYLIENASLEETTFDESFSAEEKASVNLMAQLLVDECKRQTKIKRD